MSKTNEVQTTRKSLTILEELVKMDGAGLEAIATHFEMPKSTVHGHLKVLEEMGYVTNTKGRYKPTLEFLYWGNYVRNNMEIFQVARTEMKALTAETGESTSLVVEEGGRAIIVYNVEGQGDSKFVTSAGTRTFLHTNASGKAILSQMSREEVEAVIDHHGLPALTEHTVTDPETLFAELEEIRERGYAINQEEALRGMKSIAAPITDIDGNVIAAIAVFGPTVRMDNTRLEGELPMRVLETANVIEVNYNYD
ncbi:IclR family transcriptional regulator [Halorarius litoreus]|uniref:IclR family transcriptional regulator n=1 Tax=Halorarius litoreus TaxID=2962676 RepID=UPI0020CF898D|nr:IclR family transcriptional regulator [Halorarius litoreus]